MKHVSRGVRREILMAAIAAGTLLAGCTPGTSPESPGTKEAATSATRVSPAVTKPTVMDVVVSSEPWTFEDAEGVVITTPNFRIFTTSTRPSVRERLPKFMESALLQYTSALGPLPLPSKSLETFLLASRPQWVRMTQRLMGNDAEVYLKIQRGGFTADGRAILFEIGRQDTYAISAHEGWHQYTQKTFRNPLPVWMEEGLACYMEGFRTDPSGATTFLPWANVERFDELRDSARNGRLMPLPELIRTSPQQLMQRDASLALTYYAQLWGLVHFLNEGEEGRHGTNLRTFVADAAGGRVTGKVSEAHGARAARMYSAGRPTPQLFATYFGASAEALDGAYVAFVKDITRLGAKQLIVQGKSPVTEQAALK